MTALQPVLAELHSAYRTAGGPDPHGGVAHDPHGGGLPA